MLSQVDYAGSGHKLCEAIRQYTDHDIEIYAGKYYNPYRHADNSKWNRMAVRQRIEESDIIHLKGDWLPRDGYMGFKISHKPVIVTVSGSHFRKTSHGGHGKYKVNLYRDATIRTAFTPDLCYPEYSDTWTAHPIDSYKRSIEWEPGNTLVHMPTQKGIKGTGFISEVFDEVSKHRDVETKILEGIPHKKAISERKRATIFFDQFRVGFYGNSALEAMQYGVPVAAWISPQARSQAKGVLTGCPVITTDLNVRAWVRKIEETLDGDMEFLSRRTKIWCDAIHSYEWVADQWDNIYNAI